MERECDAQRGLDDRTVWQRNFRGLLIDEEKFFSKILLTSIAIPLMLVYATLCWIGNGRVRVCLSNLSGAMIVYCSTKIGWTCTLYGKRWRDKYIARQDLTDATLHGRSVASGPTCEGISLSADQ